ncbi:MAG: universal stress protein [Thiobacillaceae bacterium]
MTRHLLMPWTSSDDIPEALNLPAPLCHWALQTDSQCVLLHVLPLSLLTASPAERASALRKAHETLVQRQAELSRQGLGVSIQIRIGDPAEEIEKEAILLPAFAIAMPTHAREGFERLLNGSVAESVARHSDIPQLLWNGRGAEQDENAKRTILMPVADTGSANALLPAVIEYASARSAEVVVFHEGLGRNDLGEEREPAQNQSYINDLCTRMEQAGISVHRISRSGGQIVDEIVSVAEECKAELIALATHGRTGMDRVMFGSVAEKVVRRAPCAVWVQHIEPIDSGPQEERYLG